jgi:hypothetical protein
MRIIKGCALLGVGLLVACSDNRNPGPPAEGPLPPFGVGGTTVVTGGGGAGGGAVFGGGSYNQPLVIATDPPPPISGGTLLVYDHNAAVSDPDHDQVVLVDLEKLSVTSTVALKKGDEPGRLVRDGAGAIHVVLRSGGAIATIDPVAGTLARRTDVCSYPRGIAYDPAGDVLQVACAGGELVTLSPADGTTTRTVKLARDLRDVVVDGDYLIVSRFRTTDLLVLDAQGTRVSTIRPQGVQAPVDHLTPAVAWRTIAAPGGGVVMVHQEESSNDIQIQQAGSYGGTPDCGPILRTAVSIVRRDGSSATVTIRVPLAVDIALTSEPTPNVVLASAGLRSSVLTKSEPSKVAVTQIPTIVPPPSAVGVGPPPGICDLPGGTTASNPPGQVVAVATDNLNRVVMQTREPYALVVGDKSVTLPGETRKDTGHDLFHLATSSGLACASCHPEGREDGHTWVFGGLGPRRTQSIGGGILGTEPFHWSGDMSDFLSLAHHVFNDRMSGPNLDDDYVGALSKWIDKIPAWKPGTPSDAAAAERGRVLFNSREVGCADCHTGGKLTNNATVDVGTGEKFQVPSLRGIAWRPPFMHNGCAASLADRFSPCGGSNHGHIPSDGTAKADILAYLETL